MSDRREYWREYYFKYKKHGKKKSRGKPKPKNQSQPKMIHPTKECFVCQKQVATRNFEKGFNTCKGCVYRAAQVNEHKKTPVSYTRASKKYEKKIKEDLLYFPESGIVHKVSPCDRDWETSNTSSICRIVATF